MARYRRAARPAFPRRAWERCKTILLRIAEVSIWEAIHAAHQKVAMHDGHQDSGADEFKDLYAGGTKKIDFAKLMAKQFSDVDEFWPRYKALATAKGEKQAIARFEGFWKQAVRAGSEMLRFCDEEDVQFDLMYEKVDKADDVIDYKMQMYIQKRIDEHDLLAVRVRNTTIAVVMIALLLAMVISVRISRSIVRPIAKLRDAADEIGKGRLDTVVEVESKDEIGELAAAFNSMAALRKAADETVRVAALKHQLLFESSRDALMTLAPPSWKFTSANEATLQLFGASSVAEFTALGPWNVSPERQPDGHLSSEKAPEMIAIAMREGSHFFEWEHQRLGGQPFVTDVLLTRMKVGEDVFLQATVRDITERKRIEDALMTTHEELTTTNEELVKRSERLEKFQQVAVNREMRMVEMKDEVNGLLERLGEPRKYEEVDKINKR